MSKVRDFVILAPARLRFWWLRRKLLRHLDRWLETTLKAYSDSQQLALGDLLPVLNAFLFVLLLHYDLSSLTADMIYASDLWRRKLVARQIAVLLYEAVDDLLSLLGRDFRKGLAATGVWPEIAVELNGISKQLKDFKNEHENELKEIRNIASAHRDHDAITQVRLLVELDPLHVYDLACTFSGTLPSITLLFARIVEVRIVEQLSGSLHTLDHLTSTVAALSKQLERMPLRLPLSRKPLGGTQGKEV